MTTMEEDVTLREIELLFERMVVPHFDAIEKRFDELDKRLAVMDKKLDYC